MAAASSSSYAGPPIQSMVAATPLSAGAWARWAPTVAWWRSSCTPTTPVFSPMHLRREDGEIRVLAEFLEVVGLDQRGPCPPALSQVTRPERSPPRHHPCERLRV
jgi:fermentation-respiration switch protein FrsA (DUF1100 family)